MAPIGITRFTNLASLCRSTATLEVMADRVRMRTVQANHGSRMLTVSSSQSQCHEKPYKIKCAVFMQMRLQVIGNHFEGCSSPPAGPAEPCAIDAIDAKDAKKPQRNAKPRPLYSEN